MTSKLKSQAKETAGSSCSRTSDSARGQSCWCVLLATWWKWPVCDVSLQLMGMGPKARPIGHASATVACDPICLCSMAPHGARPREWRGGRRASATTRRDNSKKSAY